MKVCVAATVLAFAAPTSFAADQYTYHVKLTPENSVIGNYPKEKKPILTVKSGDTVRIDGGGGNRWGEQEPFAWIKENGIKLNAEETAVIKEVDRVVKETPRQGDIKGGHLLIGPIAVDGAMPGDTLEVQIVSITPRIPYGTVGGRPGRGGIPDDVPKPFNFIVGFDDKRTTGTFMPGIELPLRPFMGVMATQPPDSDGPNRKSGPPGMFGGNLDCKDLIAGTSLYLPVFQKGALFYTGDSHAGQGDGEVTVNAIETANTAILKFVVHKGTKLKAPRAETPKHFITFGLDPDLDKAMTMAIHETNTWMQEAKGLDFERAFALSSIGVDFRVTQVVDDTKGVHAMIPKSIFIGAKHPFWTTVSNGR